MMVCLMMSEKHVFFFPAVSSLKKVIPVATWSAMDVLNGSCPCHMQRGTGHGMGSCYGHGPSKPAVTGWWFGP